QNVKSLSYKIRKKTKMTLSSLLFNKVIKVLARAIRQEKEKAYKLKRINPMMSLKRVQGFPSGPVVKSSPRKAEDTSEIPG
ncbi:unnamed protein product, partial [Rangifer tarandus platyrhynchus]